MGGGSGQMGRGIRSVRQGRQLGWVGSQVRWVRGWIPGAGGYLTPFYLSILSPKPLAPLHPLCPSPHCCLQLTYTGLKKCFNQIHFQIDFNVFIDNITTHICIIAICINHCLITNAATACFWIITALTFIGITTAITIEGLIGLSLVFDSEKPDTTSPITMMIHYWWR